VTSAIIGSREYSADYDAASAAAAETALMTMATTMRIDNFGDV